MATYPQYLRRRCFDLCDELGIDNCKIELVEYCPCDTIEELRRQEGFRNRNTDCLNKQIAGQKHHEHYMDNIEHCNARSRKHYYENRNKI